MRMMEKQLKFILVWLMSMSLLTDAYPVESKPLNNNPDTWNFGEGWLIFNPRNSADPSASALIGSDPHVKKSKITPKSIFIAPNAFNDQGQICPLGYRVDDNGKCITTVKINQDEILAARIKELFGGDENPNRKPDIDSDYYDFDDETKSDSDSGPLQINLPLFFDIKENDDTKKVEYVIEDKVVNFSLRNLSPNDVTTTTEDTSTTTTTASSATETTDSVQAEESSMSSTITVENFDTTTTTELLTINSSPEDIISTTLTPATTTNEPTTTSTTTAATTTTSTTTTTQKPQTTTKIFSVDFLPKRKINRNGQESAQLKNVRNRDKIDRPRKQKTTVVSTKSNEKSVTKLYKIEREQVPKKNRTRNSSKRPGQRKTTTTTEIVTEQPVTTTQKPFWWLPKGWSIDETKEKPVLVRFWTQQPLSTDERARSHNPNTRQQRVNSRMPSDNIFREITAPELESVLKK